MTDLLEKAVDRVRGLSSDDVARMMLMFSGEEQDPADLSPEDEAAVLRSREAADRGDEIAGDEIVIHAVRDSRRDPATMPDA